MRLIDADKIEYWEHTECAGHGEYYRVRSVTDEEINKMPTVDAAEVVRCKDCKWRRKSIRGDRYLCVAPFGMSGVVKLKDDDFCSYGERVEE